MNVGLQSVSSELAGIWSWWSDEMRAMLPGAWQGAPSVRDRFDIYLNADNVILEVVRDGEAQRLVENRPLAELDEENWEQISVFSSARAPRLLLSAQDYLEIPLSLPKAAGGQLRSVIELQLPSLVPINPETLDWNFIELARDDTQVHTSLIIARSSKIDELEEVFAHHGLMPPEICAQLGETITTLRKPLEIRASLFEAAKYKSVIAAGAMLAMIPLLTIGGAEFLAASNLSEAERLQNELKPKLAREREAMRQEKFRRAVAPVLNIASATNRLEALAVHLPQSDWAVSSHQHADGRFELIADMADRDAAEAAFRNVGVLSALKAGEEIPTENLRSRVRYEGVR